MPGDARPSKGRRRHPSGGLHDLDEREAAEVRAIEGRQATDTRSLQRCGQGSVEDSLSPKLVLRHQLKDARYDLRGRPNPARLGRLPNGQQQSSGRLHGQWRGEALGIGHDM